MVRAKIALCRRIAAVILGAVAICSLLNSPGSHKVVEDTGSIADVRK